jgi:hypothetical protein
MPAATRPTTLVSYDVGKLWVTESVTAADAQTEPRIVTALDSASEAVESLTGRIFVTRSVTEVFDGDGTGLLLLEHAPVVNVTSIEIRNGDDWTAVESAFDVKSHVGAVKLRTGVFPRGFANVRIVYHAGYGEQGANTLPADIVGACLNLAKFIWQTNRRGGPDLSSVSGGGMSIVIRQLLPPDVKSVLDRWSRPRIG